MQADKQTIIIIDDEQPIVDALRRDLAHKAREIICSTDPDEVLAICRDRKIDMVISDYQMPKMNGVALLTEILAIQESIVRIICSGYGDLEFLKEAINKVGINRFIEKPWDSFQLEMTVSQALSTKEIADKNIALLKEIQEKNNYINQQQKEIARLEAIQPGITKVNWDTDGAIIIKE